MPMVDSNEVPTSSQGLAASGQAAPNALLRRPAPNDDLHERQQHEELDNGTVFAIAGGIGVILAIVFWAIYLT